MEHPDGSETSFAYDGLGRRVEVNDAGEVSRFVWDGLAPLATLDGDDNLVSWQTTDPWGDLLAEWTASGVRDLLHDHMWSRTGWLENGSLTWDPRDSFGNAVFDDGGIQHQALTWHSQDATGLMYMYARYMDPKTGRFISEDPVFAADQYSYALNNPMTNWDPFGAVAAIESGSIDSGTSKPTAAGAANVGCKVRCMMMTTASATSLALLGFGTDVFDIVQDAGECALSGGTGGRCFPADTPVESALGPVSIQELDVGAKVLALEDEGNDWSRVPEPDGVLENEEVSDVQ